MSTQIQSRTQPHFPTTAAVETKAVEPRQINIALIGVCGVGKTALRNRIEFNTFTPVYILGNSTSGEEDRVFRTNLGTDSKPITAVLRDCSANLLSDLRNESKLTTADAIVVVTDDRLIAAKFTVKYIAAMRKLRPGPPIIIAQNKTDVQNTSRKDENIQKLLETAGAPIVQVSARLGTGTRQLMETTFKATFEKVAQNTAI
jgi:GTPase SAR1 family protein